MFTDNAHASLDGIAFTDGSSPVGNEIDLIHADACAMCDSLVPEAVLSAGDAPSAALMAIERTMHLFILTPADFDTKDYRAIYDAYLAAEYIRKKKLGAVHSPMLADSKITLLKKVMLSGRLGDVQSISARAGAASAAEVSMAVCESIAPILAFLSNTGNKLDFRFSTMKRTGSGPVPPASLSISGDGADVSLEIEPSNAELSVTIASSQSTAVWRENDLTISHGNGFKEHYTYAETDTERTLKSIGGFFDFISHRSPYVHCPLEDLYAPMQMRDGLHTISNGAAIAEL